MLQVGDVVSLHWDLDVGAILMRVNGKNSEKSIDIIIIDIILIVFYYYDYSYHTHTPDVGAILILLVLILQEIGKVLNTVTVCTKRNRGR